MECTESFTNLLSEFQCIFTQPSFLIFVCLMTGWVFSHRRRFVTELIWSSGCTHKGHHSRYHRFFSKARWCLDALCCVLAKLLVAVFAPTGMIELAVDDTLCRKRGLTVYGTGMHHDPLISSRAKPLTSWGHDWVVVTLIIRCPFWAPTKVWSLGIAYRLYRNRQGLTKGKKKNQKKGKKQKPAKRDPNHRTRPELAVELISLVASWFPQRKLIVSGDSAYGGASVLQKLPANVELISHVHPKGTLVRTGAERQPNTRGAGRKKGKAIARDGSLGRRWHATMAGIGLRPVRPARDALGQDDSSLVLHGGQGPVADHRVGPRCLGQASRPDVLLHLSRLGRPSNSFGIFGTVVDRGDFRELQATVGSGRSGQPQGESRTTNSTHGVCPPQPDRVVVSSSWASSSAISRSALVSTQGRTVVRRHAHHPAAAELARQNSDTAVEKQSREKDSCPACRIPQSCRLASRLGRHWPRRGNENQLQNRGEHRRGSWKIHPKKVRNLN